MGVLSIELTYLKQGKTERIDNYLIFNVIITTPVTLPDRTLPLNTLPPLPHLKGMYDRTWQKGNYFG